MLEFEKKLAELGPGKLLASMPIDAMITMLGTGVARAQEALDKRGIDAARALGETMVSLPDPKDPSIVRNRSLLSLGFVPTFYQFSEASLELKVEMHYQVEENLNVHGEANVSGNMGPVAIAASANADYGRKFGMDASMMTHLRLNLVSVPPPQAFLEFVRASAR